MHVLVLGAAGMVGRKLIERLARDGALGGRAVTQLTAADVVEPEAVAASRDGPFPVRSAVGDFSAPGEAEKLILAEARGKLRLALRSVEDDTYRAGSGVKEIQVTGVPPKEDAKPAATPAPAPAPAPKPVTITPTPAPAMAMTPAPAPAAKPAGNANEREIEVVRGTNKQTVKVHASEPHAQVTKSDLD